MKYSIEGYNNEFNGALGSNLTGLKETLLSNFERMEAVLLEAKSTASREAQQYEEFMQREEAKVSMLEAQLQEKEEGLTAKTQELEHRLTEKEGLLDKGGQEIMNFRSEAEAIVLRLQALLQGNGAHLETREAELVDHTSSVAPLDELPGFVNLREDLVVSLNLLGKKPVENDIYLTEAGEEQNLKSMAAKIEKLRVEVREKDVLVAAREMQVKMIKQALVVKIRDLERTIHQQVTFRLIATSA